MNNDNIMHIYDINFMIVAQYYLRLKDKLYFTTLQHQIECGELLQLDHNNCNILKAAV